MARKTYTQAQRAKDYVQTFDTDAGKRVLKDLCKYAHVMHPSYTRGEPTHTAFKEGERNVVLRILSVLSKGPEYLGTLMDNNQ